jgi:hypothetical protein
MHKSELNELERAAFERAMVIVDGLSPDSKDALLERAVATSLRYAREKDTGILASWSTGLLQTLRMRTSKQYAETFDVDHQVDRSRTSVRLSDFVASLRK